MEYSKYLGCELYLADYDRNYLIAGVLAVCLEVED